MRYSCRNCHNLKVRNLTKTHLQAVSSYRIKKALDLRNTESLGLDFPFNLTVYKRIKNHGSCKILYCAEHRFKRDLYIFRENLDIDSIYPLKNKPCPKYK